MHPDLKKAIMNDNFEIINQFLNTNHYESDSEWTTERVNKAYIEGWKECLKYGLPIKNEN